MRKLVGVLFRYKFLFVLVGIVIVALAIGMGRRGDIRPMLAQQPIQGAVTVKLTETGFEPNRVIVVKGTTVTFRTTRSDMFWPASDLHPTHDMYSEFDRQEPTDPNKTWSFRFDRVGTWKYHDHLFPYYRGTVTVTTLQ